MKIVVLDGFLVTRGDLDFGPLDALGEVRVYADTPPETRIARLAGAVAAFVNRAALDRAVLSACPDLRFIGVMGTGYNCVDIAAARDLGITVCNVPDYSSRAVAQMTFALLLEITCRTALLSEHIHARRWLSERDESIALTPLMELDGRTMGVVGMGSIGRQTARIAAAFGMRVLGCRRSPSAGDAFAYTDLDTLLRESDVVSLHCPLTSETRGIIGAREIARMKDGAILLNTARGGLVDEDAAVRALDSGKLYAVGADVLRNEPPRPGDALAFHPRCVATPHVAWAPRETRARLIRACAENLRLFLAGTPRNTLTS